MARVWKHVFLVVFLAMFWDHISAEDQQQQTQDVSLGGVLVLTFQPFDRNKMFLVKRKEGEVTNIKVRTWSSWTAGSVPTLTDQASEDPAFDGRVESTYVSISNTLTVRIKDFRATDTGPGVYYEFQQSGRRSQKFYPNIQAAPPRVPMFNIADVGEDFANISFQQVEPWDSAPVNYSVQYKETGDSSWRETQSVPHDPNASSETSRQILVQGLSSGVGYQFRVVSSNRFGSNFSHIEEARTKGPQNTVSGPASHTRYFASIFIPIGISIGLVLVVSWCLHKRWKRSDQRDPENPEGQLTQDTPLQLLADPQQQPADPERQPLVAPVPPPAAVQDPAGPERQPVGGPKQQPPVQPPAAAPGQQPPGQQPPAQQPPEQQPPVQPPVAPGQSSSEDRSIIEPPRHHSEPGEGPSLRAVPDLVDVSPVKPQPLTNGPDIQTGAAPSSLPEKSFQYRAALYYDKKNKNNDAIRTIRGKLEEWGFQVYDQHRDGEQGRIGNYTYSVQNCRHGIFCLPIKNEMDEFQFNVFLANTLKGEDNVPARNKILISFHDDDMENTVDSVKVYLADAEAQRYEKPETFDWRELFRRLASPGSPLRAEEVSNLLAGVTTSVEDLAAKLNIPPDVVRDVVREFGNDAAAKRELVRLWKGSEGPQATRDALLRAVSNKGTRMEPSSNEPGFTSEQPSSTVEYLITDKTGASELDNMKDSPTLSDPKEQGCNGQMEHPEKSITDAMDDEELLRHVLSQSLEDYNTLEENRLRLEKHVSQSGLVFRDPVPEDGNCLFHAISDQLGRVGAQQLSHQDLRAMAVAYLRSHPLTSSGDHRKQWVPDEDWNGYLDKMTKDGEWGDHLVIIALADQLQRDIRIVSNVNSDEYDVITEPTSGRIESNAPILLGHYAGNHYVSLDIAPQESVDPSEWDDNETASILPQSKAVAEVQDEIEEKSMSYESPPQKDDEATPLLSQLPQPDTKIMTKGLNPQMPVSQIPFSVRLNLTNKLSVKRADGSDWRLLAEILGYNDYIALWDQQQGLPAEKLLLCWQAKSEATVGRLKQILLEQKMGDIANVLDIE